MLLYGQVNDANATELLVQQAMEQIHQYTSTPQLLTGDLNHPVETLDTLQVLLHQGWRMAAKPDEPTCYKGEPSCIDYALMSPGLCKHLEAPARVHTEELYYTPHRPISLCLRVREEAFYTIPKHCSLQYERTEGHGGTLDARRSVDRMKGRGLACLV
eukprot:3635293-Amphidinium_carterae.1